MMPHLAIAVAACAVFLSADTGTAQTCIWSPNCTDPRDHEIMMDRQRRNEAEALQRQREGEQRERDRKVPGPKVIQAPTASAPSGVGASYENLARQPASFLGRMVAFRGKVIQSVESGEDYTLRINVTPGAYNSWTDTMLVNVRGPLNIRILEGDIVDFQGKFLGVTSYVAVFGQTIQIPHVLACDVQSGNSGIRTIPRAC